MWSHQERRGLSVVEAWRRCWQGDGISLIQQADSRRVAPLLYRRLEQSDLLRLLPSQTREALHEAYLCNLLRNVTIRQQLSEVLRAFQDAGIPVVVLKGAHLAEIVYGDPALRPMADLDLLVRDQDLTRAETLLLEIGYGPMETEGGLDYDRHHHLRPFVKPGAVPVEVHRTIERRSGAVAVEIGELWHRSREAVVAGVEARVLCPEDLLLHLCLHTAYNHRFEASLLHLCDIATTVERYGEEIDWPGLAASCERYGAGRFVHCALSLAADLLVAPVPPAALTALGHGGGREIVEAARAYILSPAPELPAAWQRWGEHDDLRGRLRSLARNLFPPRTELGRIYGARGGSKAAWLWYLVRPLDLLRRRSGVLLGLVLRSRRLRPALKREKHRRLIHRWVEGSER